MPWTKYSEVYPPNETVWISNGRQAWITEQPRIFCQVYDLNELYWQHITPPDLPITHDPFTNGMEA